MLKKSDSLLPEDRRAHGRLGYQSKEDKRQDAVERQAERATRTPVEQIAVLDWRLGVGQGAVKERKRLLNQAPIKQEEPKRKPMTKAEIAAGIEAYNPANM